MGLCVCCGCFFFQAEDGIRDLVRSRGLGDVYKRQGRSAASSRSRALSRSQSQRIQPPAWTRACHVATCQLPLRRGNLSMQNGWRQFLDAFGLQHVWVIRQLTRLTVCLLYTSEAADERSSVDLGGRRNIKKNKKQQHHRRISLKKDTRE